MGFREDQIQRIDSSVFAVDQYAFATPKTEICVESGVRVITFPHSYYTDSQGYSSYPMQCLLSSDGELLVKKYPGILSAIDGSLIQLTSTTDRQVDETRLKCGTEVSLSPLYSRPWSLLYLMTINKRKYVVKARNLDHAGAHNDIWQPFNHEHLQSLYLRKAFHKQLIDSRIRLPSYLYTSPHVCIRDFEEGTNPTIIDPPQIKCLVDMYDWVNKKRTSNDPLWTGVRLDVFENRRALLMHTDNLIQGNDGSVVIIDPFFTRYESLFL